MPDGFFIPEERLFFADMRIGSGDQERGRMMPAWFRALALSLMASLSLSLNQPHLLKYFTTLAMWIIIILLEW